MPTLHVGKKRVNTVAASDSSTVPLGSVAADYGDPVNDPAIINISVDPATNDVTVTGVAPGGPSTVIYSAPGYNSVSEQYTVSPLPSLVITDGPEE